MMTNEILRKVDVVSMQNSLEVRVPFLESSTQRYLFDRASTKMTTTKPILRSLAKNLGIPLYNRAKSGFGWPVGVFKGRI